MAVTQVDSNTPVYTGEQRTPFDFGSSAPAPTSYDLDGGNATTSYAGALDLDEGNA